MKYILRQDFGLHQIIIFSYLITDKHEDDDG